MLKKVAENGSKTVANTDYERKTDSFRVKFWENLSHFQHGTCFSCEVAV